MALFFMFNIGYFFLPFLVSIFLEQHHDAVLRDTHMK